MTTQQSPVLAAVALIRSRVAARLVGQMTEALPQSTLALIPTDLDPVRCWPWQGRLNSQGYGVTSSPWLGTAQAHRQVLVAVHGPEAIKGKTTEHVCHRLALEFGDCAPGI